MAFIIMTDAGCDLDKQYIDSQHDFQVIPMDFTINGETDTFTCFDGSPQLKTLYDRMRAGDVPTTAQINLNQYLTLFTDLTQQGNEILYLCLSSGLSGTYQTAQLARQMVIEKNPGAKLFVVDSLCASSGQGLLVHYALQMRDQQGMNAEQLADWVTENRQHITFEAQPSTTAFENEGDGAESRSLGWTTRSWSPPGGYYLYDNPDDEIDNIWKQWYLKP